MRVLRRLLALVILAGIIFGVYWSWKRIHRADAPSTVAALAAVARGGKPSGELPVGVWTAQQSGTSKASVSVLSVRRSLPARALLELSRSGASVALTWRFSAGTYDTFLVRQSDRGLLAVGASMGTTTPIDSKGASATFKKSIVLIPRRLKVGVSWSATYPMGSSVVVRKSRVAGRASSKLPGVGVVWRIRVSEEWTGTTAAGNDEETILWSPKLHLPIGRTVDRNLQGSFAQDLRATLTLPSTTPLAAPS
jgi:hypothetical protein